MLVVGTNVNGNKRMAFQIRFKNGNNRVAIASNSITLEGQSNASTWIKFVREKNDLYYLHENFATETTNTTSKFITNQNYVNNKIESVRINAATNYVITSGTFMIYGKVRSEFM